MTKKNNNLLSNIPEQTGANSIKFTDHHFNPSICMLSFSYLEKKKYPIIRLILSFCFCFFIQFTVKGQNYLPPNQPEQDACSAILVCSDSLVVPYSYFKYGEVQDLTAGCTMGGEVHSLWLKFEIATAGIFMFTLIPNNPLDNHEVSVFAANTSCNNVSGKEIRCTRSTGYNQGIVSLIEGTSFLSRSAIEVYAGEVYYILINNFGEQLSLTTWKPTSGFVIHFNESTSTFVTGSPPQFLPEEKPCVAYGRTEVRLSKPIKCNSIASDGSDFSINNNGHIYSAIGSGCSINESGFTDQIRINFSEYLPPGDYTIKAQVGTDGNTLLDMCDQQVPVNSSFYFTVPKLHDTVDITVCPSQMPYSWNDILITQAGNNIASFKTNSTQGCDSFTILNLNIEDTLKGTEHIKICSDEFPYTWNGMMIYQEGNNIAQYYSINENGCDSLTTLDLETIQPVELSENIIHCGPYIYNGITYSQSQVIFDTLKSRMQCDSIYKSINLVIYPELIPAKLIIDTSDCGFVIFNDFIFTEDTTISDTLLNMVGCDSVYRTVNISAYPNVQARKDHYLMQDCYTVEFEGMIFNNDTVLTDLFTSSIGCDSAVRITQIQINKLDLELTSDPQIPVFGDLLTLSTNATKSYTIKSWSPTELFEDQQAISQYYFIEEPKTFKVTGISEEGCTDSAILNINPETLIPEVVIPNAFSPNNDGINDVFKPEFINQSGHTIIELQIFNRLGQAVYKNFSQRNLYWDGTFQGKPAPVGTYYYYIIIEYLNGKKQHLKGELNLIR